MMSLSFSLFATSVFLLIVSGITLAMGILWAIAWINKLSLFVMRIYKDQEAEIDPKTCMPSGIFFGIHFITYALHKILMQQYFNL